MNPHSTSIDPIWKQPPFEHQTTIADFHFKKGCTLDGSDVGVGKTPPMIVVLQRRITSGDLTRILIVCRNSGLDNWANEIKAWSDMSAIILQGTKKKRVELLGQEANIYLLNYEGVRVIQQYLMAKDFDAIICDEIHWIKNYRAQVTKAILALAKYIPVRKGMTGTLLTRSIEDVWSIAQFISPAILATNYWGFRNKYMVNKNTAKPWMNFPDWQPKPGAAEEIKRKLAPHMIRFKKREVLKWLPPVLFERRSVELSTDQRRAYRELKQHFITELEDGEVLAAPQILTRITKLLQMTSGFTYREAGFSGNLEWRRKDTFHFTPNAKLTELKAVLDEIGDQRVVIWAAFTEDVDMIRLDLGAPRADYIDGRVPQKLRQGIIDQFNNGAIQYLVCHPATVGESVTILAPYVIYYSRNWMLGQRLQSLGRHDRPGSERFENVTVIDLVAKGTIDETVIKALEDKEDLMQSVTPQSFRGMM